MGQVSWSDASRLAIALTFLAIGYSCGASGDGNTTPSCSPACMTGFMCCPGTADTPPACRSTQTDSTNCGGCGVTCGAGQTCMAGTCRSLDAGPIPDTGPRPDVGIPVPPPPGDGGSSGPCMPSCSSDQQCCSGTCANRVAPSGVTDGRSDSSFRNCGRCGNACDPMKANRCGMLPGGTGPQCMCGTSAGCAGAAVCVLEGATYRCVDSSTDPRNCGTPPVVCAEGEMCRSGMCQCGSTGMRCGAGQSCCGGACVNTATDPMNCGSCGRGCPAGSTTSCVAGVCSCGTSGRACRPGTSGGFGGDPSLGEVCCGTGATAMCVTESNTNCGMCGTSCNTADGEACTPPSALLDLFETFGSCCANVSMGEECMGMVSDAGDAF